MKLDFAHTNTLPIRTDCIVEFVHSSSIRRWSMPVSSDARFTINASGSFFHRYFQENQGHFDHHYTYRQFQSSCFSLRIVRLI